MARKRFTPEQIVAILREAERGTERKALFRRHGISEQTFYRWKRMYGGLGVSEVKRIKQLDGEPEAQGAFGGAGDGHPCPARGDEKKGGPELTVTSSGCWWGEG